MRKKNILCSSPISLLSNRLFVSSLFLSKFTAVLLVSVLTNTALAKTHELKASTTIQVILHKQQHLKWPRAETPTHYMTMVLHTDLDEAARMATSQMLDFLVERKGMKREDAYMLSSAAMDLTVTQVVDGTKGIHALIPKSIFKK
jgi:acetamidase/formamidase